MAGASVRLARKAGFRASDGAVYCGRVPRAKEGSHLPAWVQTESPGAHRCHKVRGHAGDCVVEGRGGKKFYWSVAPQ